MNYSPVWKFHQLIRHVERDLENSKKYREKLMKRRDQQWGLVLTLVVISVIMNLWNFSNLDMMNLGINAFSIVLGAIGVRRSLIRKKQNQYFLSLYEDLVQKLKNTEPSTVADEADFERFIESYTKDYKAIFEQSFHV